MTVQYFERARFEWQPGTWPARWDTHLGLLGNVYAAERDLLTTQPFAEAEPQAGAIYFEETGHNLAAGFRRYWEHYGGLAIFGYPISEEFVEDGLVVQYFERQRFEWHPGEWPERWDVMLGLLGTELYGIAPSPQPEPEQRVFTTTLSGMQEVPPVDTEASGSATFTLSEDGMSLAYEIEVADLDNITMAHIHLAGPGANGPVIAWLFPEDGPPPGLVEGTFTGVLVEGTITAEDFVADLEGQPMSALIEAFENGGAYVNVHTEQYPAGEIRGQINADIWVAPLSGDQEVPAVETDATGIAHLRRIHGEDAVGFVIQVENLDDITMAHIHLAPAGENGNVVAWLFPEDGPPAGLLEGTHTGVIAAATLMAGDLVNDLEGQSIDDLIQAFESGDAYVNVHTEVNPSGEIRGQIQ